MLKRLTIITAMMIMNVTIMFAQWDVQFSDYTAVKSLYNPAVSGTDGLFNAAAAYSLQMAGYDDAPRTMYIGADIPVYFFGPRHGAGVSILNDEIGIFTTQKVNLQYAFNMKMGKKGKIAFGVQGSMLRETIDPKNMKLDDPGDPAFPTSSVNGSGFDLGAGIYYYHPKYWAGISAVHLTEPLLELGETHQITFSRMYYLMAGGNINIKNTLLSLQPSLFVQSDLQSWREDVQCKLTYEYEKRKFYCGVGYSPNTSVTALIGGYFHGIKLGYSYQMYTGGVGLENGSHEIVLSYQTDLDLFKKGRNRHKSVRFL